jgi:zinc finger HIT domain-containing protein 1
MNNFGVIEVAGTKTTHAPGWAYVPDVGLAGTHLGPLATTGVPMTVAGATAAANAAAAGAGTTATTQPRKRARNAAAAATISYADLTARQEAKARRELEVLDRDNARDVVIPLPPKPSGATNNTASSSSASAAGAPPPPSKLAKSTRASASAAVAAAAAAVTASNQGGGGGGGKHTPNVRRILQSQKTFANHLDDYLALGYDASAAEAAGLVTGGVASAGGSSRSAAAAATAAISRTRTGAAPAQQQAVSKKATSEDVEMGDADAADEQQQQQQQQQAGAGNSSAFLRTYTGPLPPAHPDDDNPLLVSRVPPLPADDELAALLAAPPLSYLEARAGWGDRDRAYPVRAFCEVCGYWGRVRCMKCGVRVCALDCLETHREECYTRYGL